MNKPPTSPDRLTVAKTYKLYIDGKFPRSESGRTIPLIGPKGTILAHACRASRKDVREAVVAARKAQEGWGNASAYLRGQILYRMAEMLEARRAEFEDLLASSRMEPAAQGGGGSRSSPKPKSKSARTSPPGALATTRPLDPASELSASIDRLIAFAGWADKYSQVLGCNNPITGPYYNFTVPEPTGVVAVIAPDAPPLLSLISLLAPPLCAGNAVIALAGETPAATLAAVVLAEVIATSDVPGGVVNILTGLREELLPVIATHRDIDAISAAGASDAHAKALREGAAENVKRVLIRDVPAWTDAAACESPWWIEPMVELKTIWHPSGM